MTFCLNSNGQASKSPAKTKNLCPLRAFFTSDYSLVKNRQILFSSKFHTTGHFLTDNLHYPDYLRHWVKFKTLSINRLNNRDNWMKNDICFHALLCPVQYKKAHYLNIIIS